MTAILNLEPIREAAQRSAKAAVDIRGDLVEAAAAGALSALRAQVRAAAELAGIDTRTAEDLDALLALLIERARPAPSPDEPLADEADRAWEAHGAYAQPTAHGGAWRLGYVAGALRAGRRP